MGSLERRLERLEEHTRRRPKAESREMILRRMTGPELDAYEAAIVRSEVGEGPTEADRTITARMKAIREEIGA